MNENLRNKILIFNPDCEVEAAKTPPASWYRDVDILELEKEKIFKNNWTFVGHHFELIKTGDFFTGNFFQIPYIISKQSDGSLKGLYNVCSHHGTCVAKGKGSTKSFSCPYHGWEFGLEGKLKKAPRAGALGFDRRELGLKTFPVQKWGPFLFANFSGKELPEPEWPTLYKELEAMNLNQMKFITRKTYPINCNWKVFIDNYLDGGYHVPVMHPGLSGQLNLSGYHSKICEDYSIQYCESSGDASHKEKDFPKRLEGPALYGWIYPNLAINRYGEWMDTNWVVPTGASSCEVVFDYFHAGPISDTEKQKAFEASHQVQLEDTEICHMVQAGLESGVYIQGIYAPMYEKPMFHFHQLLTKDFLL